MHTKEINRLREQNKYLHSALENEKAISQRSQDKLLKTITSTLHSAFQDREHRLRDILSTVTEDNAKASQVITAAKEHQSALIEESLGTAEGFYKEIAEYQAGSKEVNQSTSEVRNSFLNHYHFCGD